MTAHWGEPRARSCSAASSPRVRATSRASSSHARGLFERSRSACGPPGLLSEEFDVGERQIRGNVPQAFAHALLLESAHHLAEPA